MDKCSINEEIWMVYDHRHTICPAWTLQFSASESKVGKDFGMDMISQSGFGIL